MIASIEACRICGNRELAPVVDLGDQALTGVFPRRPDHPITTGPLRLVKCVGAPERVCGLVQLAHTYPPGEMYGNEYGYRSGLNASMVRHLRSKVDAIMRLGVLRDGDLVLDIGSNDGSTLSAFPRGYDLVGIDPAVDKFRHHYPEHVRALSEFFSAELFQRVFGERRARVITSFSMFYDLDDPVAFARDVMEVLEADGIWVLEQSYLPEMLRTNSYDTICHEHIEYYAMRQIRWIMDHVGAKVLDVEFNDVNGGSFSVTVAKAASTHRASGRPDEVLRQEAQMGLNDAEPLVAFGRRAAQSRDALRGFIRSVRQQGASVAGLGASTKGNVLLQYCGLSAEDIDYIGEVNEDKFGAFTPGTLIPIIPERELLTRRPDYVLVLPWHYRSFFEASPALAQLRLVFALPELAVVEPRPV